MIAVSAPAGTSTVRSRGGVIAASRRTIPMQWHIRAHDSGLDTGLNANATNAAIGGADDAA
jgi:hypothetical protein